MEDIVKEYPYFSEDENGKWKHYRKSFKSLIEPSDHYVQNNKDIEITVIPSSTDILQKENKVLNAKIVALTESNQFLEDCIVEMAEIVYA